MIAAWVATAIVCAAAAPAAPAAPTAPTAPTALARLEWLAGCWKRESTKRLVEEQWMAPAAGLMLGSSRTVSLAEQRVVEYEQLRIEEKDGRLVFTSLPSGQSQASFTSITLTDSLVVFENATHDFPQRVAYRRGRDGSLEAWIEGTVDGKSRKVEFPYVRAVCPSGGSR
ncbi:MAG: DUF6265 family protein [Candidatus Eiseniibacteriota bacterium]